MRERINRLARGIIENGTPELSLVPEQIEAPVAAGEVVRAEIMVNSKNNLHIKGLVYSSNERVRVVTNAFGGLRNRIIYEVNSRYSEHGDEIKGSFYLVTNGGEREIPYSLRVQAGNPGENLGNLTSAREFANLARRDLETALRVFEYQDFTDAPFMQDIRTRTIYEGLKGRTGRRNLLEEFLVALRVKDPVALSMDTSQRTYSGSDSITDLSLDIASSGWGYVKVQIQTDAPFIRLMTNGITDQDFSGNRCKIRFHILKEKLHRGKNFGRIKISSLRQQFCIEIEAEGGPHAKGRGLEGERPLLRENLFPYLNLRLDYETGMHEPSWLVNQMMKETERLRSDYPQDERIRLLQAELLLLNQRTENASMILEEAGDGILKYREEHPELYCYYQYLLLQVKPSADQKETLIRYMKRLLWEDGTQGPYVLLLLMKLDSSMTRNPLELYHSLESMYRNGSSSPFLYAAACRLIQNHPDLYDKLGDFEVQMLHLGARRGMVTKELALKTARFSLGLKYYRRLTERLLVLLYEAYPEMELLEALCSLLIKGERRGRDAFLWYEKALKCKVNLTRLYEYFLYALPEDYGHLLPKEVLLYFSYDKDLDFHSRLVLYENILLYMNPSSELYETYTRYMEQFAMEQLFQSKINSQLAVIYEHTIYRDMIDARVARVLPGILRSCRIKCEDDRMKYVIVRYEELEEEEAYLLENQEVYVPVFSKHYVLLFQDAYGNRYLDVKHRKMPVMDMPKLLEQCYQVYPDHPMLRLRECSRILEQGVKNEEEAGLLEETMTRMKLNPVFRKKMLKAVTECYCRMAGEEKEGTGAFNCTYLVQIDKKSLESRQRQQICETLIGQNYMQEAYEMIRVYGSQYIPPSRLMKLCTKMILQQLFDQDDLLLNLAFRVFQAGKADSVILDYLGEHFNGTVSQMYAVLIQGAGEHVETYDMAERLLCQMLFTGCCQQIDSVFDLYMKGRQTRESVIKAYFTQKSTQYFLEGEKVDGRVFSYLKQAVKGVLEKDKIPTIYLLALTRYFSTLEQLDEDDTALCRAMTGILLEEGLIFPYTRDLSRHIAVPEDILDKAMVEYRGKKEDYPELLIRILPQEEEFRSVDMRRVYQGIYVKEKVLFEGEIMEYRIYETKDMERTLVLEGQIECDHKLEGRENSRFACLNKMGAALREKDEQRLLEAMEDYLKKSAALGKLFPIE